ncbi:MAG: hypothetical protein HOW73_40825 [Polyangiaceae bacterium]|nr:hypothetical protein [Polyangiaceae bacterium]
MGPTNIFAAVLEIDEREPRSERSAEVPSEAPGCSFDPSDAGGGDAVSGLDAGSFYLAINRGGELPLGAYAHEPLTSKAIRGLERALHRRR